MGVWEKIKGWLNIGGVKVRLEGVEPKVPQASTEIAGRVVLTSKGDKHVFKIVCKLLVERTTGTGAEKKTVNTVLGETCVAENFEIKTGETQSYDFRLPHSLARHLDQQKGVFGTLGAIATSQSLQYKVIAQCDVKDTVLDPNDYVRVTIS